jgi:hypothetical protein
MLTKIVLAAALVVGSVSATLAKDSAASKAKHARASYAQSQEQPSPNVNPTPSSTPTGAARPLSQFEKNWFDFQNHD